MITKAKYLAILLLFGVSALVVPARAQVVFPFQGLGNAQFFDNNGKPLTAGVLYSYQAGTTMQQATYTDSTGTILNPNPIPFGSGARVQIWLSSGAFYKFVLCQQNDGPTCAPADVLFSVDQVPGNPAGLNIGNTFIGTYISGSANPATTGILRLATGDQICWRNQANTANLCIFKDSNDVLGWQGNAAKFAEGACSLSGLNLDFLCASSANHRWMMANNGGAQTQIVGAGVDINTSDQVIQLHFGATATPISPTPPTTGQALCWNGTQLAGCTVAVEIAKGTAAMGTAALGSGVCGDVGTLTTTSGNVANVLATDVPSVAGTNAANPTGSPQLQLLAIPSAGGLTVEYCNTNAGSITPAGANTVNWVVLR